MWLLVSLFRIGLCRGTSLFFAIWMFYPVFGGGCVLRGEAILRRCSLFASAGALRRTRTSSTDTLVLGDESCCVSRSCLCHRCSIECAPLSSPCPNPCGNVSSHRVTLTRSCFCVASENHGSPNWRELDILFSTTYHAPLESRDYRDLWRSQSSFLQCQNPFPLIIYISLSLSLSLSHNINVY